MKKAFKYMVALAALLCVGVMTARAEDDEAKIVNNKTVSGPDKDGVYTLTLESYVTGKMTTTVTEQRIPVDVVLVLDASGSMDENIYIPTEDRWFSCDDISNGEYYYKFEEDYYLVEASYRRLHFDPGFGWAERYLKGDHGEPTKNQTNQVSSNSANVWKGVLYTKATKMNELKRAVSSFVDEIKSDAETNNLDNTISVVKFADDSFYDNNNHLREGNHRYSSGYNYTELVKNHTSVSAGASSIKSAVNSIVAGGATAADYGMSLASEVFNQDFFKGRVSSKVVIMFTDGEPNHGSGFSGSVANSAVSNAKALKDNGVIIYTIGQFSSSSNQINRYMNAMSSNYPNATEYTAGGTDANNKYYYNSDGDMDMTSMFTSIEKEISEGGASITLDESALVLDVITDSFQLPEGTQFSDIKMYTSKATVDASGNITWASKVPAPNNNATDAKVVKVAENDNGTTDVVVNGFDFSAHWVGVGAPDPYKFIIEIPIKPKEDAVGGTGVETNVGTSGVYYPDPQTPTNPLEEVMEYPIPKVNLPVKIQITKTGLKEGESAIFVISRRYVESEGDFTYFTKVILTGNDSENTPKVVLKDLDPNYIYKITESDWSWTYTSTNEGGQNMTTEGQTLNPFKFSNAKKSTDVPSNNAEAAVHNVFEQTK